MTSDLFVVHDKKAIYANARMNKTSLEQVIREDRLASAFSDHQSESILSARLSNVLRQRTLPMPAPRAGPVGTDVKHGIHRTQGAATLIRKSTLEPTPNPAMRTSRTVALDHV